MPRKDGTGPIGQGSLTGRGMGNCSSTGRTINLPITTGQNPQSHWGGLIWDATMGRLFGRRRRSSFNSKIK
jgi:hypothetical protein